MCTIKDTDSFKCYARAQDYDRPMLLLLLFKHEAGWRRAEGKWLHPICRSCGPDSTPTSRPDALELDDICMTELSTPYHINGSSATCDRKMLLAM